MAFFFGMLPAFPLAVATGSMEPAIEIGDAVVIGRTDAETLQEGQVIAYRLDGQIVVHRITERTETALGPVFRTKGDHNNAPDLQEVTADQICGRVLLVVPKGGTASLWLRQLLQLKGVQLRSGRLRLSRNTHFQQVKAGVSYSQARRSEEDWRIVRGVFQDAEDLDIVG